MYVVSPGMGWWGSCIIYVLELEMEGVYYMALFIYLILNGIYYITIYPDWPPAKHTAVPHPL